MLLQLLKIKSYKPRTFLEFLDDNNEYILIPHVEMRALEMNS